MYWVKCWIIKKCQNKYNQKMLCYRFLPTEFYEEFSYGYIFYSFHCSFSSSWICRPKAIFPFYINFNAPCFVLHTLLLFAFHFTLQVSGSLLYFIHYKRYFSWFFQSFTFLRGGLLFPFLFIAAFPSHLSSRLFLFKEFADAIGRRISKSREKQKERNKK